MIPWALSTWSTNDALDAVGLKHADGHIKRGSMVERDGGEMGVTVGATNEWLKTTGQIWQWAVIAEVGQ